MDGHEADLVGILVLVLVLGGEEQHLLQELVEGAYTTSTFSLLLFVSTVFGKLGLFLAELFHTVQQLLDVLDAIGIIGVVVVAQQGDDATVVDYLLG